MKLKKFGMEVDINKMCEKIMFNKQQLLWLPHDNF